MKKTEINKEFINEILKSQYLTTWAFNDWGSEIVPIELTHESLIKYNPIDENILLYYFKPTSRVLTDKEWRKMLDSGYIGKRETALYPYSFKSFGAYHHRMNLYTKLSRVVWDSNGLYVNDVQLKYFDDLIPYFKEYAAGFKQGYNEFDKECIQKHLTPYADKTDFVQKVFEFLTANVTSERFWGFQRTGFKTSPIKSNDVIKWHLVDNHENGLDEGYFYRAWSIVFSNNHLFTPLFKEQTESPKHMKLKKLNSIWLADSKLDINKFMQIGIESAIWDENFNIKTQKGSLYGTGKTLLGSLSIALKGFAISRTTDYKKIGKVFCEVFNQTINKKTNEPYKAFSSGNQNIITQMKRVFNVK